MPYVEYDEVEAICPECGRMFRSAEALDNHLDEVHRSASPLTGAGRPSAWACATCNRKFGSEVERNRHARETHAR